MSLSAKAIQSKIGSVKNIKKITKAMELVSVSKMQKAVAAALATREYAVRAVEILKNISTDRFLAHPFLHQPEVSKELIVVISSNKGLCGGFNANIRRKLGDLAQQNVEYDAITVGKYSERTARSYKLNIIASFVDIPEEAHIENIHPLMHVIREKFEAGEYSKVYVVYTNFKSALTQEPHIRQLLPITEGIAKRVLHEVEHMAEEELPAIERESMKQYVFEPTPEEVVETVLPRLTEMMLYQMLLESRASEHSARMMAMKNASENAEDMVARLTLTYNKARQAAVTREISEIAAGAEALG